MDQDDMILAYIQGRMSQQESDRFEHNIRQDTALAAEVAALQAARVAMEDASQDMPKDGWARLSTAIDGTTRAPANDNRALRLTLLQAACVAVLSIASWQVLQTTVFQPRDMGFAPASAPATDIGLQVIFAADARQGDVTELLDQLGATIKEGPSAMGLYHLEFIDDAARSTALEVLRNRRDIAVEVLME